MRDSYREQLDDVLTDLVHMAQVVSSAVRSATTALLEADIHLAEQVISDDELIDAKQADIEARSFSLLARQAPVAGELRTLVATLRMVTELERMGRSCRSYRQDREAALSRDRGAGEPASQLRTDGRRRRKNGDHGRADTERPQH
jgi:phosphate uptake regulator